VFLDPSLFFIYVPVPSSPFFAFSPRSEGFQIHRISLAPEFPLIQSPAARASPQRWLTFFLCRPPLFCRRLSFICEGRCSQPPTPTQVTDGRPSSLSSGRAGNGVFHSLHDFCLLGRTKMLSRRFTTALASPDPVLDHPPATHLAR